MVIGHLIRRERLNIKMKQTYLAKGICSPSYLSKIENNEIVPSKEILELISIKLNIDFSGMNQLEESQDKSRNELKEIYKEVTVNRNLQYAKETLIKLFNDRFTYINKENYYAYNLLVLRLLLARKDNNEMVDSYLQPLLKDQEKMSTYQNYLLKKIQGIHSYHLKNFSQSLFYFEEAISFSNKTSLADWENADFNYMYSLTNLAENNNINAIDYSNLALQHYLESFQFKRAIECFLIQGIAFKKSNKFKEALAVYQKANEISDKFKSTYYKALIAQNLGSLYASLEDFDTSLKFYMQSFELKSKLEDKALTIFSIIQVYSKQNNVQGIIEWTEKGLNEIKNNSELRAYSYHFNLYRVFTDEINNIDTDYLCEAINYFESINDYRHTYKYCIKMGNVLENGNKYKKSNYFYKKAISFNNKQLKYQYWEDI